jgi:cardiolipin synthase
MEVFDRSLHEQLAAHIDKIIAKSHEITFFELKAQSLPVRLRNSACWVFSPYL